MGKGRRPAVGLELRTCLTCKQQFQPYRDSQVTCSIQCYRKQPRVRKRENAVRRTPEFKARKNEWRRNSARQQDRMRAYNRKQQLAKYGLTPEDYDRLLAEQQGLCALCGRPPDPNGIRAASKLHADHCHASGRSRALLCLNCNHGLGCFGDDPALLRRAAEYIEHHRT